MVDPNYRFKLENALHEDPNFIKELIADMQKKLTPNNCAECPHTNTCPAPHYGGDGCRHIEAITDAILSGKPK